MLVLYKKSINYIYYIFIDLIEIFNIENVQIINYYYINVKGTKLLFNIPS